MRAYKDKIMFHMLLLIKAIRSQMMTLSY